MGAWNTDPWGNDDAADWFAKYWKEGFALVLDEVRHFSPEDEGYDRFRAACHVLACFGSAYAWPSAHLDERVDILTRAIEILRHMIDPPDESWEFLDLWDDDEDVIASVQTQIGVLESYLK